MQLSVYRPGVARLPLAALVLALAVTLVPGGSWSVTRSSSSASTTAAADAISVLFSARPGQDGVAASLLQAAGGKVPRRLGLINAYVATVPADAVEILRATSAFAWISPDREVTDRKSTRLNSSHG